MVIDETEGTRVDLGDDLLEKTRVVEVPTSANSDPFESNLTPAEIEDRFQSARILLSEGLVDEAKKLFRKILVAQEDHAGAQQGLREIHERELKQIFGGSPEVRNSMMGRGDAPVSAPREKPEEILRKLDEDLGLGVFSSEAPPPYGHAMSLFQDRNAMDRFCRDLDAWTAGTGTRERMDLGIAFLEMGLYDLAIRQLKSAAATAELAPVCLYCYALILGGQPFEATLNIQPFLADLEIPPLEKIELTYLMARAHESLKRPALAKAWYEQVRKLDPHYRDVEERLHTIREFHG